MLIFFDVHCQLFLFRRIKEKIKKITKMKVSFVYLRFLIQLGGVDRSGGGDNI